MTSLASFGTSRTSVMLGFPLCHERRSAGLTRNVVNGAAAASRPEHGSARARPRTRGPSCWSYRHRRSPNRWPDRRPSRSMIGMNGSPDAVVVGSGPNGLAAALRLAAAGLWVRVVERNHSVGGGIRSDQLTLPGFTHDLCASVHPMAAASPFFRDFDLAAHGVRLV